MENTTLPSETTAETNRRQRWRAFFGGRLMCRRAAEKESLILGLLCMLDMYTTLYWVVFGEASEANPVLAWTFKWHEGIFVAVKSLSCLPAVILAPRLAQKYPFFTVWLLRLVIVAYIWLYFTHVR
jgi:hypothetical protein